MGRGTGVGNLPLRVRKVVAASVLNGACPMPLGPLRWIFWPNGFWITVMCKIVWRMGLAGRANDRRAQQRKIIKER